jgi:hypothetical protein
MKIARVQTEDRLINQIQQNIATAVEPIFNDLTGSFQVSLTGCTTVPTGSVRWQRATTSGPVTLQFPLLSGTSNLASSSLTGLPASLWPTSQQAVPVRVYDNGTLAQAIALVNADGSIELYKSVSSNTFTTSGTKGIALSCVTYSTAV